jgi:diguanylate cyclase (GGDEF)-like protein
VRRTLRRERPPDVLAGVPTTRRAAPGTLLTRLIGDTESAALVEQTRRLFAVSAVFSLVAALVVPVLEGSAAQRAVLGGAALVLIGCWARRLRGRRDPLLLDVVEPLAVAAVMLAVPAAPEAYAFVFPAVWLRALCGSATRAARYCALLSLGAVAVLALRGQVAVGVATATGAALLLVPLPVVWLTMGLASALARSMAARERARRYDAALVRLGRRLIGRTDRESIYDVGQDCLLEICASTPGLALLILLRRGDRLDVHKHLGAGGRAPAELADDRLADHAVRGGPFSASDLPELRDVLGGRAQWHAVGLAEEEDGWFLVGAAPAVPPDALVAVQSQVNQLTLALRTCDAHDELRRQARVDSLTGLPNRAAFLERLDECSAAGAAFSLLFLDLDDFKRVNDDCGHAAGDELLTILASRLRSALRPQDFCARLGGDEFAVLLPDSQDVAVAVAQRLVDALTAAMTVQGRVTTVGVSVGVACSAPRIPCPDLLTWADAAMYGAKALGKNQVRVFDPALLTGPPVASPPAAPQRGPQLG